MDELMERNSDLGLLPPPDDGLADERSTYYEPIARGGTTLQQAALAHRRVLAVHADMRGGQEPLSQITVLFKGWGCRYRLLPDGRRQILDVLLPGDIIGLGELFKTRAHEFVQALTEVTCGDLDSGAFMRLLADPDVALHVMAQLGAENRRLDNYLATLGQMVAEERIAALLVAVHHRLEQRQGIKSKSFQFPLTQQQLGDFLGMTVVHVNRVLKRLRDSGIVNVKHRVAIIEDMAKLVHLASGRAYAAPRPVAPTPSEDSVAPSARAS
jgi:CRP-like cAMP-binding protein